MSEFRVAFGKRGGGEEGWGQGREGARTGGSSAS